MNPIQLYTKQENGEFKPIDGWGCGNCRRIVLPLVANSSYITTELGTEAAAIECCQPKICACGCEIEDKDYKRCKACSDKEWKQEQVDKELKAFNKAKKLTEAEYTADASIPTFVFDPSGKYGNDGDHGWNNCLDTFYQNYEDALYEWESGENVNEDDEPIPKPELPKYVWASRSVKISYDVSYITEHVSQDCYEDYEDHLVGVDELQKYLDEWCAQQPASYEIDYSTAIILNEGCHHCWKAKESQFTNEKEEDVFCTKCNVAGSRCIETREVTFPAT